MARRLLIELMQRHLALDEVARLHVVHVISGGDQTSSLVYMRCLIAKPLSSCCCRLGRPSNLALAALDQADPMAITKTAGLAVEGLPFRGALCPVIRRKRMNEGAVIHTARASAVAAND